MVQVFPNLRFLALLIRYWKQFIAGKRDLWTHFTLDGIGFKVKSECPPPVSWLPFFNRVYKECLTLLKRNNHEEETFY